jgi:hypothetical protein
MKSVTARLGSAATMQVIEGADHSFKVPKRSGRTNEETVDQMADATARWADALTHPTRR